MREHLKISYSCYIKNKNRPSARYYARVRESGHVRDIDLATTNKSVADAWVQLRRSEVERYNQYLTLGEEVPTELEQKIVRVSPHSFAQKGPSKASVSMHVCLDSWEADMRRRGLREQSISAYMRAMAVTVPKDAQLSDVDSKHVVEWLSTHDHCKSATRRLYSVALREFYKFLSREYNLSKDLILDWPIMVKTEHVEKDYWTLEQMASIIDNVKCKDKDTEEQFKAYLWIMATIGSRQGETALLRWRDWRDGCITFRAETTKSNKTRVVPLNSRIDDMLHRLRMRYTNDTMMFEKIPKSQSARYQLLKYAIVRAKMPRGGLHQFRRSVSMYLYSHCKDIKAVAQILGHSEQIALQAYQKSRAPEVLKKMVEDAYRDQILLPDQWDDLIKNGLV